MYHFTGHYIYRLFNFKKYQRKWHKINTDFNIPIIKECLTADDLPICFLSAFKATDDEDDATTT